MAAIYGVFPYPDGDATTVREELVEHLENVPKLTEQAGGRLIALSDDEDISFGINAPTLDQAASITPDAVPSIVLRRSKGGVLMDKTEGRDVYVDLLITIYEELPRQPPLGYALDKNHAGSVFDNDEPGPLTEHNLDCEDFYDGAWMMFFPPRLVDRYGRERLHDLPARRIDDLDDGTVVVVARGDPADYTDFWDLGEALELPARVD